jgi:glycosyltransferase involved in cell wall biosynthesis
MTGPVVSAVLPVFNGERWVLDAIRSIQQQSFTDWELIILDDGSTDNSMEICQACAHEDQRIRVYANGVNLGLAKAMNKLVRLAKGKYIAVQEQDDIAMPDRFSREVALFDSHSEVGLVSGVAAWMTMPETYSVIFPAVYIEGSHTRKIREIWWPIYIPSNAR